MMLTTLQNFGKPTPENYIQAGEPIELVNNEHLMNEDSLISHYFPSSVPSQDISSLRDFCFCLI